MLNFLATAFKLPELRKKLLFTLFVIIIFRLLSFVPLPGVDILALRNLLASNELLGFLNTFSGGGLANFSIITLGLGPYINASIIIQLMTLVFPQLEALSKEGEMGRQQLNQYTRFLTMPLSIVQSYSVYVLLRSQSIISELNVLGIVLLILTLTAGTCLLMWLGDLLTERGIGNGISMLIFVGIISALPSTFANTLSVATSTGYTNIMLSLVVGVAVIAGVVLVNEGTRNVRVEYAKRIRGADVVGSNFLPLKLNQAGVIPIIFALSLVLLPSILGSYLQNIPSPIASKAATFMLTHFSSATPVYTITYFILVVLFTYFYTSVQFNPEKIAENLKKSGGFIPGIRPGKPTTEYLKGVVSRITLAGALFLGLIAILPSILQYFTNVTTLTVGGTSLLIVVSVVLETVRQIESIIDSRKYDSLIN